MNARKKYWEKYKAHKPPHNRFNTNIRLSKKERVIERIKDEIALFASGKVVMDEKLRAKSIQEYSNLMWNNENQSQTLGSDHCINANWYAREPYFVKLMKGIK